MSILKCLKVLSLACKCVFCKRKYMEKGEGPIKLNFEGLEMHKWNIPIDRVQRIDEKMGSFV